MSKYTLLNTKEDTQCKTFCCICFEEGCNHWEVEFKKEKVECDGLFGKYIERERVCYAKCNKCNNYKRDTGKQVYLSARLGSGYDPYNIIECCSEKLLILYNGGNFGIEEIKIFMEQCNKPLCTKYCTICNGKEIMTEIKKCELCDGFGIGLCNVCKGYQILSTGNRCGSCDSGKIRCKLCKGQGAIANNTKCTFCFKNKNA